MFCSPGVSSECSQLEASGRVTSQLSERLQDMIAFHTMHKNTSTHPPTAISLSLSPCLFSAVSLKPRSSFSLLDLPPFPISFPFLHSPCLLEIRPHTDRSQFLLTLGAPSTSCPGSGGHRSVQLMLQ